MINSGTFNYTQFHIIENIKIDMFCWYWKRLSADLESREQSFRHPGTFLNMHKIKLLSIELNIPNNNNNNNIEVQYS